MSSKGKKRERMRLAKQGIVVADVEEKKAIDPVGSCSLKWFKKAKNADQWKPKWECMQQLMEFATGDPFGNAPMPKRFQPNKKAQYVLNIFSNWLNDDNGLIITRKHIFKLLIPFGKSYDKSCWKNANSTARGIMQKQWMEKQPNFLPIVTPGLIAVYEGSQSKLSSWKSHLVEAMKSEQSQIRMSAWDFLAKICIIGGLSDYNVSNSKTSKDIKDILNDDIIMSCLQHALLEDQDKATRNCAAKFVYGAKNLIGGIGRLKYNDIRNNKRASMALDIAGDNYNRDVRILKGLKAPTEQDIQKKQQEKQARSAEKDKRKRQNNMRAAIMAARRKAKKQGGSGGEIQIAYIGSKKGDNTSSIHSLNIIQTIDSASSLSWVSSSSSTSSSSDTFRGVKKKKQKGKKKRKIKKKTIVKKKDKKKGNYNNAIVDKLVNTGIGSYNECMAASLLVDNYNDINVVANKVDEIKHGKTNDETIRFNPINVLTCISQNNENENDNTLQHEMLYNKHCQIMEKWNVNSSKLKQLSMVKFNESVSNDDEKKENTYECDGIQLFNKYSQCCSIIDQQSTRLTQITTKDYLLELINLQNSLSKLVKENEVKAQLRQKEYIVKNKEYKVLKQQRLELQNKIKQEFNKCNEMIQKENALYQQLQQTTFNKSKNDQQVEKLKASSETCVSVIKLYNEFMENNKEFIEKINANFDNLWNKFESKWMRWDVKDILVWFKYKTIGMNKNKTDWGKVQIQLQNRNITGKYLKKFNDFTFELIGVQDFEIVTHLVSEIEMLKKKYDGQNKNDSVNISKKNDIPKEFLCPITKQIMRDPVIAFDGHSYDRNAIESYLKINKKSPITGANADYVIVFPNHKLKADIENYVKKNNIDLESQNEGYAEGDGNETVYV